MMNRQMPDTKPLGNSPKPSPPIPAICTSLRVHCHPLSGALTRLIRTTSQVQLHQSGMQPECKSSFGLDAPARTHGVGHKPMPGSFFAPQVLSKMHHLHHYRPFRKKKLEMFCAWCESYLLVLEQIGDFHLLYFIFFILYQKYIFSPFITVFFFGFGCVGPLLLHWAFSGCSEQGLLSSYGCLSCCDSWSPAWGVE